MGAVHKISGPHIGTVQGRIAPFVPNNLPHSPVQHARHSATDRRATLPCPHAPLAAMHAWRRPAAMSPATEQASGAPPTPANGTLLCTSLTAATVAGMLAEAQEAAAAGADIVELRLDYLEAFAPENDLPALLEGCPLPAIVTFRPTWEG